MASTTAAIIGLSAAAGLGSAAIGGSAATSAADTQAAASEQATQVQQQEFNQTQANEAPWIQTGQATLGQLAAGLQPGGIFTQPNPAGTFTAPTLAEAEAQPGYQFAQTQGDLGIEQGAAAAGGAFNTGTLKSLANYNTGLAQTSYQNTYNNALNTYLTQFNAANTNTTNLYNRLAGVSGTGQVSANTLGQIGATTAANIGNTITSGAAATAAGQVGAANAIINGLTSSTNSATGYLTLQQLLNGGAVPGVGGSTTTLNPNAPGPTAADLAPVSYDPNL